jgi:hypothetical protein
MRHTTKTDTADAKSAHITTRPAAQIAAVLDARLKYGFGILALGFRDLACLRH